jgi:hypothetical protein
MMNRSIIPHLPLETKFLQTNVFFAFEEPGSRILGLSFLKTRWSIREKKDFLELLF